MTEVNGTQHLVLELPCSKFNPLPDDKFQTLPK